jgi:flagellar motility protein MotE (MotC chaperone)
VKKIALLFILMCSFAWAQTASLVDIQEATVKIRAKEQELTEREQALNAREQRLNALEQDLITREDNLKSLRTEIDKRLASLNSSMEGDIDGLSQIYTSTNAKQAAAVLVKIDVQQAAALLRKIPPRDAGRIMGEMAKLDVDYSAKLTAALYGGETITLDDISRAAGQ